jgi:hypothetical protein
MGSISASESSSGDLVDVEDHVQMQSKSSVNGNYVHFEIAVRGCNILHTALLGARRHKMAIALSSDVDE